MNINNPASVKGDPMDRNPTWRQSSANVSSHPTSTPAFLENAPLANKHMHVVRLQYYLEVSTADTNAGTAFVTMTIRDKSVISAVLYQETWPADSTGVKVDADVIKNFYIEDGDAIQCHITFTGCAGDGDITAVFTSTRVEYDA